MTAAVPAAGERMEYATLLDLARGLLMVIDRQRQMNAKLAQDTDLLHERVTRIEESSTGFMDEITKLRTEAIMDERERRQRGITTNPPIHEPLVHDQYGYTHIVQREPPHPVQREPPLLRRSTSSYDQRDHKPFQRQGSQRGRTMGPSNHPAKRRSSGHNEINHDYDRKRIPTEKETEARRIEIKREKANEYRQQREDEAELRRQDYEGLQNPATIQPTLTTMYHDPYVIYDFPNPHVIDTRKKRKRNWDGSIIDPNCRWNSARYTIQQLMEHDYGNGPYRPNFDGADYLFVMERIINDAALHEYPPRGLSDARQQTHLFGMVAEYECLCCFGNHWTAECPVFALAEDRRRLFEARRVCISCRRRHVVGQLCCYVYLEPELYRACGERECEGLPRHNSCLCSSTPRDKTKKRDMNDAENR